MKREAVLGFMITLIVVSVLTLAFNIQQVKAIGTITIKADGSIDPPTANITSADNVTYTFISNITCSIVVQRDNIVVNGAGYTVTGIGGGTGIALPGRSNVTLKNVEVTNFVTGIYLYLSSLNNLIGNTVSNNLYGITLEYSWVNVIAGNTISANYGTGITLDSDCDSNFIFHNNFIDNAVQALEMSYNNFWDDGYPSGGNYWSDYTGVDLYSGPDQNEAGSDGIGDTPYYNLDWYPLMNPYVPPPDIAVTSVSLSKTVIDQGYSADVNVTVNNQGFSTETFNVTAYANTTIIDKLVEITLAGGSSITLTFTWNTTDVPYGNYTITANATILPGETDTADNTYINGNVLVTIPGDVNGDGIVDIFDLSIVGAHWGESW